MNDTQETPEEKAERWYKEYERERAEHWEVLAERNKLLDAIGAMIKEADTAERRNRDVPVSALRWALREFM